MEFTELIDQAIMVVNKKEVDDNYKMFWDRYKRIREHLEYLRNAYINKTLNNTQICLNIMRMIDHGDDEELHNALLAVNRYYQDNIYMR